jgi:hypothetical protein
MTDAHRGMHALRRLAGVLVALWVLIGAPITPEAAGRAMSDRYTNKPLVMLLEKYVLWSIGELSSADEAKLREMAPHLGRTFSAKGTWQEVVASVMEFPPDMPATFNAMWLRNQEIARENGAVITPQRFAEMLVDENFPM